MKKKVLLVVTLALAAVMCVALAGCGSAKMKFVTGGESGTYYAFGTVIAQHATNNVEGLEITAVSGNGSQSNVQDVDAGDAQLAFCQADVAAYAYTGTNIFEKAISSFSVLGALYDEQVQIVTLDPTIKSVSDLRGKRVSIGAAGSGVYFNAIDILGVYGMTENDIVPTYQSFGDSAADLKDGKIDAAFIVAGAPTGAVTDLGTSNQVYLVSLDNDHVAQLLAKSPYYTKATIAASTYGLTNDVITVAVPALIIVSDKAKEDAVYNLCKDIFDNPSALVANHAKYAELSLEYASAYTAVPYHAGAAKYFAEKGFTVATK